MTEVLANVTPDLRDLDIVDAFFKTKCFEAQKTQSDLSLKKKELAVANEHVKQLQEELAIVHETLNNQLHIAKLKVEQAVSADKERNDTRVNEKKLIEELAAKRKELAQKSEETAKAQQIADDLKKVTAHLKFTNESKDEELKRGKDEIKAQLQQEHSRALESLKAEHKRELDRLRSMYEENIVDLTVQNYGNQQSGNDTLKQKILLLKDEIKTLKGDLEKTKRKEVRFAESPPSTTKGNPTKRKAVKSQPIDNSVANNTRKKFKSDDDFQIDEPL